MKIKPVSHLDHGLASAHLDWLRECFQERDAFFIATVELPTELPSLSSGLYGPLAGDPAVDESEVYYAVRGSRKCASRLVGRPCRPTREITIVAGPHEGDPCVLYTCYGGPAAPREPGDTSLGTFEEIVEARKFWAEHALSDRAE